MIRLIYRFPRFFVKKFCPGRSLRLIFSERHTFPVKDALFSQNGML